MSDYVVCAKNLTKTYKLYNSPKYRLYDLLGLLKNKKNKEQYYREHKALSDVNISIKKGEKVGIIGRNGAGKSTFLKLVTNVIEPTSGELRVYGETQALLQIGTSFHPEFSGRENVISYLHHLGIKGKQAESMLEEIIAFAEIEEFIDQPIKVYSTGMGMRLMFSASTVIKPNILVIDEVLGVGDAYFASKSFNRIESLCNEENTTLLLVSHDIYSSAKLCDRMIWIEKGKVILDSDPLSAIKAYEDSIRVQEEERLRAKTKMALSKQKESLYDLVTVEICSKDNRPLPCSVYFSSISLKIKEKNFVLPILTVKGETKDSKLIFEGSSWGEISEKENKKARSMLNYGTVFHKVAGAFYVLRSDLDDFINNVKIEMELFVDEDCEVLVNLLWQDNLENFGNIELKQGNWQKVELKKIKDGEIKVDEEVKRDEETKKDEEIEKNDKIYKDEKDGKDGKDGKGVEINNVALDKDDENEKIVDKNLEQPLKESSKQSVEEKNPEVININDTGIIGSGGIEILSCKLFNAKAGSTFEVLHGDEIEFVFEYKLLNESFCEKPDICLVFYRAGTRENLCRYITRDIELNYQKNKIGKFSLKVNKLNLAAGNYSVAIFVAKNNYLNSIQEKFYTLNDEVYLMLPELLEFKVICKYPFGQGTVFVGDGIWSYYNNKAEPEFVEIEKDKRLKEFLINEQ